MSYWQLYYHLVWGTKNRQPLLTPEVEPIIYKYLFQKAGRLEAVVHALNGIEDHIHMVASIPPKIAVSKFVGQIKATGIMFYKLVRCPMNEIHRLIRENVLQTRSEERLFEHVLSTRHRISFGGIYFT